MLTFPVFCHSCGETSLVSVYWSFLMLYHVNMWLLQPITGFSGHISTRPTRWSQKDRDSPRNQESLDMRATESEYTDFFYTSSWNPLRRIRTKLAEFGVDFLPDFRVDTGSDLQQNYAQPICIWNPTIKEMMACWCRFTNVYSPRSLWIYHTTLQ